MIEFDQSITWRELEARLATTTNARHRAMIENVIEHGKAECAFSVDRLMATLSDEPAYHFWNAGTDWGPKGRDAIRAYYEGFVASGAAFFESYKPRIVVDDDNIVTENILRQLVPGSVALQRGLDVPDPDGHYIVSARVVNFWKFNAACQLEGEDAYASADAVFEQVPDDELPDAYVQMLEMVGMQEPANS